MKPLHARFRTIHCRMLKLNELFLALPEDERAGPKSYPLRDKLLNLTADAEALIPEVKLPRGFRFGNDQYRGEQVYGIRILPCHNTDPALWGRLLAWEDAAAILDEYGMELRPTYMDFFLIKKGSRPGVGAGLRERVIGPVDRFAKIAHLFTRPESYAPTE